MPADLQADVESGIRRVSILAPSASVASKAAAFDSIGTDLWNGTTNLLRDVEEHQRDPRLRRDAPNKTTVLLRVFAFHLLDTAYQASPKRTRDAEQRTRNLKLALKTCRSCLDSDELALSLKVLEKCSDHVSSVEDGSPLVRLTEQDDDGSGMARMKSLVFEFYLLRVMHAWKSGRLDVAKHFISKLNIKGNHAVDLPEKAADLFYEVGRSLLKKHDTSGAMEWLERALSTLDVCEVEHLSDTAADLRLSISAKLGKCLSRLHASKQRLTSSSKMPAFDPNS